MHKIRTIQSKLFIIYSTLIIVIILVFVAAFYKYTSYILEKEALLSVKSSSNYISDKIDAEIKKLDLISQKILYSKPLKELFFLDLSKLDSLTLEKQRQFNETIYSILWPSILDVQINMFTLDGCYVSVGNYSVFGSIPVQDINKFNWVKQTIDLNGKMYLYGPHMDTINNTNKTVFSFCRAFSNIYGQELNSILEIQMNYKLISDAIALDSSTSGKKIFIFGKSGEVIYPYQAADNNSVKESLEYYRNKAMNLEDQTYSHFANTQINDANEIISIVRSDYTGWTVVLAESKSLLLAPVTKFRNTLFIGGILVLLVTLIISFIVAKGLTVPIRRIHKSISNLNLKTLNAESPFEIHSSLNELEDLNISFNKMCKRLEASLDEAIASRSHEIQARMLALQSQMNPHFLYNILSILSIMCEESGQTAAVKMCSSLTDMLRYISSANNSPVLMKQELDHTRDYLELMQCRYNNLHFTIDVPDHMLELPVPKLIIQPLVENCIKHGLNTEPPWEIKIIGACFDNGWRISVSDNGVGFNEESLGKLLDKMAKTSSGYTIQCSSSEGIGIYNIFARLSMLYGNNVIFEIHNNTNGGSEVIIGTKNISETQVVESNG